MDPEINHGIAELRLAVLTEDVAHLAGLNYKLRVDQWTSQFQALQGANLVCGEPDLELVQLNSFGCGLDAVTSDQIGEILASAGKLYTIIKIDEGNNLGAARIRIRSLIAAVQERERRACRPEKKEIDWKTPLFTRKMRGTHTILAPQMAPIHFELIREALRASGYRMDVLPAVDRPAIDEGLKYVNNDACYPAVILVGQVVRALKSGKYDPKNTSVIITQSGGGCRATNYLALLKLGLRQAGFPDVPLISVNAAGLERQPGFKYSAGLLNRGLMAFGDLFEVLYRTRPYERFRGSANILLKNGWMPKDNVRAVTIQVNIRAIIRVLTAGDIGWPRLSIVGEIF